MAPIDLQQFIDIPFNKQRGPNMLNCTEAVTEGLNCQALVHIVYRSFGIHLPPNLLSKEIFEDRELFYNLSLDNLDAFSLAILDLFIFGKQDERDYRRLHLSMYTGELDRNKDPLIIHSTRVDGKVVIWPLQKFFSFEKYKKLHAVKRLIDVNLLSRDFSQ